MENEISSGEREQRDVLIKSALKKFLSEVEKVDFNGAVFAGEVVLWNEAERTFRTSFNDRLEQDLLIRIIRECKEEYHDLIMRMFPPSNQMVH